MMDDNPFAPRVPTCLTHRKERATHLCTDLSCSHNTLLCPLCLNDHRLRNYHPHESSIKPLPDAVDWLTSLIRAQSKSIELIYQRTIGNRECQIIKFNLEKGPLLFQQLDSRLQNMKIQLDLQMQSLLKEFQKQIQLQKQQFHRKFDEYKRLFFSNLDLLRRDNMELIGYQNQLKYYNNSNSFTLKLITESERKSQDWIVGQKKVLQRVGAILENGSFTSAMNSMLSRATKSNLFIFPYWKGEKKEDKELQRQFRISIKNAVISWFQIPQLIDMETRNDYPSSNKYLSYPLPA